MFREGGNEGKVELRGNFGESGREGKSLFLGLGGGLFGVGVWVLVFGVEVFNWVCGGGSVVGWKGGRVW